MAFPLINGRTVLVAAGAILVAAAASAQTAKVCLDPGHGGSDPGGVGTGMQEKVIVLDTVAKIKAWLDLDSGDGAGGGSWTVIRTRTTDVFVGLTARADFANSNGANRFMSVHSNAFADASANGIETFSVSSTGTAADLRNKVQQEAVAMWPLTNRGNKTANFTVLTATSMPAELHEMAFITNATDASYLASSTHRNNHAKAEMFGLQRHYGLAKFTPGSGGGATVIADNGTGAWSASTNWFPGTSVAGYYGTNYHARATEAVSDQATWTVTLPATDSYRVDAWWTAAANRAASASYSVVHAGGTATVAKNQQANGGSWQTLGTWNFNAGSNQVRLSCWTTAGFFVIGDAVRFVQQ